MVRRPVHHPPFTLSLSKGPLRAGLSPSTGSGRTVEWCAGRVHHPPFTLSLSKGPLRAGLSPSTGSGRTVGGDHEEGIRACWWDRRSVHPELVEGPTPCRSFTSR